MIVLGTWALFRARGPLEARKALPMLKWPDKSSEALKSEIVCFFCGALAYKLRVKNLNIVQEF